MQPCDYRTVDSASRLLCSHPKVRAPDNVVYPATCDRCKLARASRGVGDTLATVFTYLGVKPCDGCKQRQQLLNRIIPYE